MSDRSAYETAKLAQELNFHKKMIEGYKKVNSDLETKVIELKLSDNLLRQKIKRLKSKESQSDIGFKFLRTEMETLMARIIKLMALTSNLLDLKMIKKIKNLVRNFFVNFAIYIVF